VVITGNIGRKAAGILKNAGVDVYIGAKGTVGEVIDRFKEGKLGKMAV
jgi:predicted Fe-Mo cluster-binding NifX family protein